MRSFILLPKSFRKVTKEEIRKKYSALRDQLISDDIENLSLQIANKLLEMDIWDYSYYHLYLPIIKKNEINTEYILNILAGKDKNILVSKSDFKNSSLNNILLTDSTKFEVNKYGIPEPLEGIEVPHNKIDVVFVPLLAFDIMGNRVGYGKGFYDRFLSGCDKKCVKIGLSFFSAEDRFEKVNEYDVSLDYCVTPNKIYKFS